MTTPRQTEEKIAFPVVVNHIDQVGSSEMVLQHEGMTLREWYAGQALAGLELYRPEKAAKMAFLIADAMIEESKRRTQ